MQEQELYGVPFKSDPSEKIGDALSKMIAEQKLEIEDLGAIITGIEIRSKESPPRFFITFPFGAASFSVRGKLEARGYDVGQQMGDKILKFYATRRRLTNGAGWNA